MITSCKDICFETLCWWPPMFDWSSSLLMINFPNLNYWVVMQSPAEINVSQLHPPFSPSPPPPFPPLHYSTSHLPDHAGQCVFDCLYLDFFTLIPVWFWCVICRSKGTGNGNSSWGSACNLLPFYCLCRKTGFCSTLIFQGFKWLLNTNGFLSHWFNLF